MYTVYLVGAGVENTVCSWLSIDSTLLLIWSNKTARRSNGSLGVIVVVVVGVVVVVVGVVVVVVVVVVVAVVGVVVVVVGIVVVFVVVVVVVDVQFALWTYLL